MAQLPAARVHVVQPAGARIGSTIDVRVSGADLDEVTRLVFSHPGITASPKTQAGLDGKPEPIFGSFAVTVGTDVPAGIYEVRAGGRFGLSNPRGFMIDGLTPFQEVEPNNTPEQANRVTFETTVEGVIGGASDVDAFRFPVKKGQRVLADCRAYRLDSRLDAVLILRDGEGREILRRKNSHRSDPLIDYTTEADGELIVEVQDALFAGSGEYFYRISIGTFPFLDFVFPPVGLPGSKGRYTLYGRNLPGGQPVEGWSVEGAPLEQLGVEIQLPWEPAGRSVEFGALLEGPQAFLDGTSYHHGDGMRRSNPYFVGFASGPVVVESADAEVQRVSTPCEIAGQFFPRGDRDTYEFTAKKGDVLRVEVFSHRLGLPVDPRMILQRVTYDKDGKASVADLSAVDDLGGNQGGENFNTGTDDAAVDFTVPEDGSYRVVIEDLFGATRSDPRHVYRLAVRPRRPDFRLVAVPNYPAADKKQINLWNLFLRRGATERIDLIVQRRDGFDGDIDVDVEGLPGGVHCRGTRIVAGRSRGSLVLVGGDEAPTWSGPIEVVARAEIGGSTVTRQARPGALVWPATSAVYRARSRLTHRLVLGVSGSAADALPYAIGFGDLEGVDLAPGGSFQLPVSVARQAEFKGEIQLTPMDLPPNVEAKPVKVKGDANEVKIEFKVKDGAPMGEFTVYLDSQTEVNLRRNPEAAERAAAQKKTVDAEVARLQEEEKKAKEGAAVLEGRVKELAEQTVASEKEMASAAERLAAAQKALEVAQQEMEKLQAARDAAKAEQEKVAAEKATREKAAGEIATQLKAAQELQGKVNKRAEDAAKAAAPKKAKVLFPSPAFGVRVRPAPFALRLGQDALAAKAGSKLELPVSLERFSGFAEGVELQLTPPAGVAGIRAEAVSVAKDATKATLAIEVAAEAPSGLHACSVRGKAKYGGKDREVVSEFLLTVEVKKD